MIIDGMALLFRGYYATSYSGYIMKTSKGVPTNAIYGFVKYMQDAISTFQPSHVLCCWDMGARTFRNELYPAYKANRGEPPEELIPQFDLVKKVVESFNIPSVGIEGFEADDCIGTIAKKYSQHLKIQILTGDHDSLQLIDENIHSIIMKKGMSNYEVYTLEKLLEEKELTPAQFIDLKGLMGDASDNFPGVKGIGEKTAIKLLKEYQSISGILENLPSLSKGIRTKIETELDMLHLSRKLAEIHCEVPVEIVLEECARNIDEVKVTAMFEELEFHRLLKDKSFLGNIKVNVQPLC
ncbi:5'-3' exonuclease [Anaerobacillus isosaccharinicus]|uniref:5'-3' exonuclease n=1 Tax=Anaerobacillus isosaccharinicus TaxID=1532552 RepID=A0A1S2MDA1_9BACI|nr:5'-3' exonuclease H3TH domain-containing protein [Anaerobacillus isosaccharinicus]MBA5586075.1 5'-3' exonuclease [Anaerobacillus isosaccharinicus]QOY38745.1 5'-3' exonuclease [Anaerobacillus isosaccharinicus]